MSLSHIQILKNKAKLYQKAKKKSGIPFALKEAFHTIAKNAGFASWRDLKNNLEQTGDFCPPGTSAYWKTWYASYDEALLHMKNTDHFLLPYQKHFFLCDDDYIHALGIKTDDPDLEKIGRDWTKPHDRDAWQRIVRKIKEHDMLNPVG